MTPPPNSALARRATILLILMTFACFGGPFFIVMVLQGGPAAGWPPDRPVEWTILIGTIAAVIGLMAASVAVGLANQRSPERGRAPIEPNQTTNGPDPS